MVDNFQPEDGHSRTPKASLTDQSIISSVERLDSFLEVLFANLDFMERQMEDEMRRLSLVVGDFDPNLVRANELEWPKEVTETPRPLVSFAYYKAMRLRNTASSSYIRKRYEEASRDMTGNGVIDLLYLVQMTRKEALHIRKFISKQGRFIGTASEQKVLANFEVWLQAAIIQTKRLYEEFKKGTQGKFVTEADSPNTTSQEARRSQAVLKVDLNSRNNLIGKSLDVLRRNFSDSSDAFYGKFLNNLVDANNMASTRFTGGTRKSLVESTQDGSDVISAGLDALIEDQERRIFLYRDKFDLLLNQIPLRHKAKKGIWDLADRGKGMPTTGRAVMVWDVDMSPEEAQYWHDLEARARAGEQVGSSADLRGSHNDLRDLETGDPHTQYLLRDGGTIIGDIEVDDEVRIDGVDVSEHRHTGEDGTHQIHGDDIVQNTLKDDLVDTEDVPPRPINLAVSRMDLTVVPPGVTVVDTLFEWDSYDRYMHELEVRLVPTIKEVDPNGSELPGSISMLGGYVKLDLDDWFVHEDGDVIAVHPVDASGNIDYHPVGLTEIDRVAFEDLCLDLAYLGENASFYWVGLTGGGWFDASSTIIQVFAINKTTGTPIATGAPTTIAVRSEIGGDYYRSFTFPPRTVRLSSGKIITIGASMTEDYSPDAYAYITESLMTAVVATYDFDTSTGAISNLSDTDVQLGTWRAVDDYNYPILTSIPVELYNGHVAATFTSGVFSYRDELGYDGRTNCWVMTFNPDTQASEVKDVHPTDPSFYGAMSVHPTDDGYVVSAAINYTLNDPDGSLGSEENREIRGQGDWILQYYTYDGSTSTKQDEVPFTNQSYWNGAISFERYEGGIVGGPEHITRFFGGPTSGHVVTYTVSRSFRIYTWSISGGSLSVNEVQLFEPFTAPELQEGSGHAHRTEDFPRNWNTWNSCKNEFHMAYTYLEAGLGSSFPSWYPFRLEDAIVISDLDRFKVDLGPGLFKTSLSDGVSTTYGFHLDNAFHPGPAGLTFGYEPFIFKGDSYVFRNADPLLYRASGLPTSANDWSVVDPTNGNPSLTWAGIGLDGVASDGATLKILLRDNVVNVYIASSTDGINWSVSPAITPPAGAGVIYPRHIIYRDGKWIRWERSAATWTTDFSFEESTDGEVWITKTIPASHWSDFESFNPVFDQAPIVIGNLMMWPWVKWGTGEHFTSTSAYWDEHPFIYTLDGGTSWQRAEAADFVSGYNHNLYGGSAQGIFQLNGKAYFTHTADTNTYTRVWEFDPAQDSWSVLGDYEVATSFPGSYAVPDINNTAFFYRGQLVSFNPTETPAMKRLGQSIYPLKASMSPIFS